MKFTIRDLMFVIVAAGVHFGSRYWLSWALCTPLIVALIAAIGLSRSTRSIMFSCGVGAFACLASAAELTVELFQLPTDRGGLDWSYYWDVAIVNAALFAVVGAAIGAFVGFLVRFNRPATQS